MDLWILRHSKTPNHEGLIIGSECAPEHERLRQRGKRGERRKGQATSTQGGLIRHILLSGHGNGRWSVLAGSTSAHAEGIGPVWA